MSLAAIHYGSETLSLLTAGVDKADTMTTRKGSCVRLTWQRSAALSVRLALQAGSNAQPRKPLGSPALSPDWLSLNHCEAETLSAFDSQRCAASEITNLLQRWLKTRRQPPIVIGSTSEDSISHSMDHLNGPASDDCIVKAVVRSFSWETYANGPEDGLAHPLTLADGNRGPVSENQLPLQEQWMQLFDPLVTRTLR